MQDIKVTVPIPEQGVNFERVGAEINAEVDTKVIPELGTQSKRIGATSADDVDTKMIVEVVDCPTLEVGECSQLTNFNPL